MSSMCSIGIYINKQTKKQTNKGVNYVQLRLAGASSRQLVLANQRCHCSLVPLFVPVIFTFYKQISFFKLHISVA